MMMAKVKEHKLQSINEVGVLSIGHVGHFTSIN